jgi:hypothetical protein
MNSENYRVMSRTVVMGIELCTARVRVAKEKSYGAWKVFVDDECLGTCVDEVYAGVDTRYPKVVHGVTISLETVRFGFGSYTETLCVWSHEVPFLVMHGGAYREDDSPKSRWWCGLDVDDWSEDRADAYSKHTVFPTQVSLRGAVVDFATAVQYRAGSVIQEELEHPFSWDGDILSNRVISLSRDTPVEHGGDRMLCRLEALRLGPSSAWDSALKDLHGLYASDIRGVLCSGWGERAVYVLDWVFAVMAQRTRDGLTLEIASIKADLCNLFKNEPFYFDTDHFTNGFVRCGVPRDLWCVDRVVLAGVLTERTRNGLSLSYEKVTEHVRSIYKDKPFYVDLHTNSYTNGLVRYNVSGHGATVLRVFTEQGTNLSSRAQLLALHLPAEWSHLDTDILKEIVSLGAKRKNCSGCDPVDLLQSTMDSMYVSLVERYKQMPFRRKGDCVTNGFLRFPLVRPHGHEWGLGMNRYIRYVQAVTKENWNLFLCTIDGKWFDRFNSSDRVRAGMQEAKKAQKATSTEAAG